MAETEPKTKRRRSREGGWRIIKGNLYARIQYTDETGKQREKLRPAKNKSEVWQIVRQMKDELAKHGAETLNADNLTFAELAEKYKAAKVTPAIIRGGVKVSGLKSYKSVEASLRILIDYFGKKKVRLIRPNDIEKYRRDRFNKPTVHGKERKIASVNRELQTLRAMLNFAVRQSWLLSNPFEKTEKVISTASETERNRVLTFDEENRLLSVCTDQRAHLKPILICALDTAMRPEEIFKLEWRDVDLAAKTIIVRMENSKTEKERIIGVTPRLAGELEQLWEVSPKKKNQSVFGTKSIKTAFATACRLAGIAEFRFRDARHTATTRMVNSGMPQAEVMKTTGHTQLKTFLRYVNLTPESVRESAQILGDYVGQKLENAEARSIAEISASVN
jgi:integrase